MLHEDHALLERLRKASLNNLNALTRTSAGAKLLDVYRETMETHGRRTKQKVAGSLVGQGQLISSRSGLCEVIDRPSKNELRVDCEGDLR
jgi:hypothetical protein